jgi:phage pi2 protein 07
MRSWIVKKLQGKKGRKTNSLNENEGMTKCHSLFFYSNNSKGVETMIEIKIDQSFIEKIFLDELKIRLDKIEYRYTFWDMKTLMKQTNMSENSIKEKFFYDPRFPKYRLGGKWYFPAAECEKFLLTWIREQPQK